MTSLKDLKRKLLQDREVRAEYDKLRLEEQMAATLASLRISAGLTQEQLARLLGTRQEAVARYESGRHLPGIRTLQAYAAATGRRLVVAFEPGRPQQPSPRRRRQRAAA